MPSLWVRRGPVGTSWRQVYSISKAYLEKDTEREGRGAERKADWRIGAHSEGAEKSLHLNAPLHPNSSAATTKKKKKIKRHSRCCSLLCPSLCIWASVPDTHLPAMHRGTHQSIDQRVFAEVLWCFVSADSSHFQGKFVWVSAMSIASIHLLFYPFV